LGHQDKAQRGITPTHTTEQLVAMSSSSPAGHRIVFVLVFFGWMTTNGIGISSREPGEYIIAANFSHQHLLFQCSSWVACRSVLTASNPSRDIFLTEGGADLVLVQDPWVVGGKVAGLGTKEYKLMLDPKEVKIRTCILAKRHLSIFPSHVGIAGNEFADEAAKASTISPLIASANINKLDRNRYLKSTLLNYLPHLINKTSTWYQTTNVSHLNIAMSRSHTCCSLSLT